jgi:uncharacterized membrane protein
MTLSPAPLPQLNRLGVPRLDAIDLLRGLVIALMVLDHVRDYFHADAFVFNPLDPARTTPVLYATRWITHLCAPTFVFLSGVSAFLQRANGKDVRTLSRFLLTRGAWLVALEFTIVSFGFNFAPVLFAQVIYAIGVGMIALSVLVWAPQRAVLALGVLIVAGHDALAPINAGMLGAAGPVWMFAMEPGPTSFLAGFVAYPAIPWVGVMLLGYGLAPLFLLPQTERNRILTGCAAFALGLFLLLRALNAYGDPAPWQAHQSGWRTALSFFNVTKYPPSLMFVLVTLGMSFLLLPLLERLRGAPARVLLAFGRTPLFTYLLHVYLVHGSALLLGMALGFPAAVFTHFILDPSQLVTAHWGFNLAVVYGIWLLTLAVLYPLSRWYADMKRRRRDAWLSYL